ncbi:hypothetical protein LguiA_010847 [Lonicera macranthoides]
MAYPHPQNRNLKTKRGDGAARVTSYVDSSLTDHTPHKPGGGGWVRQLTSCVPPYPSLAKKMSGECWDIASSILHTIQPPQDLKEGKRLPPSTCLLHFPEQKPEHKG